MRPRSSSRAVLTSLSNPGPSCSSPLIRYESSSSSSLSSLASSSWTRALPPGSNPAYDAALTYLSDQQSQALSTLSRVRSIPNPTPAILKRIDKLEVEAYVNDPAVRQTFRESEGQGMMNTPVIRHLAERRWKKEGGLDLIMGRVYQNKVVPDLVPDLGPTSPLTITIDSTLVVEPGLPVRPWKLDNPPRITFQPFSHPSQPTPGDPNPTGLNTLLLVDPDTPSPESQSFSQRLHYLKTDIPLSILTGETDLSSDIGRTLVPWEPPAPERGSGRHRYIFLLLLQPSPFTSTSTITPRRENFDFRRFLSDNGFTNNSIVGINLFRSNWDESQAEFIDSVFRTHRGIEGGAPVYGKPPKEMKYGYPMGAAERRREEVRQGALERVVEVVDVDTVEEGEEEEGDKLAV